MAVVNLEGNKKLTVVHDPEKHRVFLDSASLYGLIRGDEVGKSKLTRSTTAGEMTFVNVGTSTTNTPSEVWPCD